MLGEDGQVGRKRCFREEIPGLWLLKTVNGMLMLTEGTADAKNPSKAQTGWRNVAGLQRLWREGSDNVLGQIGCFGSQG